MKRLITAIIIMVLMASGCSADDSSSGVAESTVTDSSAVTGQSSLADSSSEQDTDSTESQEGTADKVPTVKEFLTAALEPCGSCLYVWSGGWNEEDTAAGIEAMSMGVSPRWKQFFNENDEAYDFTTTRFQIHDGLDCTGFLGWSVYQVFGDRYSDTGYVFQSGTVIDNYLRLFGGERTAAADVTDYRAGDIMCKDGHVFIVIAPCGDGSLLFIHASPPVVSLCGTPTPDGNTTSEAIVLAKTYMQMYFPVCSGRYDGTYERGMGFLTEYDRYRFDETVLCDGDDYFIKTGDEILSDLLD